MKLSKILMYLFSIFFSSVLTVQAQTNFVDNKTYHAGFMPFYVDRNSGQVFLEIEMFNQPFLFQSSLPHGIGSNDIGLDRGQLGDTRLVQFERVGSKVFLRQLNTYYRAESTNSLEQDAVTEAFASSIIWGFSVIEQDASNNVIIDYTPFLLSDIHGLAAKLKAREQGSYKIDPSRSGYYQKRSKAFPDNTELEATVTFKGNDSGAYLRSVTPEHTAVTVNLHHSLIRLPDDNYQTRQFHPYSGMWSLEYADYASDIDKSLLTRLIPRHRLQKKQPKATLSEAVEPIVYYLDPGVPEPVKSALIDGALWWNQAFEAIGYKDAFQVKMLPKDADPMDVRYNVIQWVHRATRGWSYGSSVIDPRTGEILKGHVTLGSLRVRQDYLIALGLTSPFSEANPNTNAQKEMALARIRQLSAHEVGHTLGIAHNFSASVNNRASVMDYPHPYVEIDQDGHIDLSNAYDSGIGDWDKHVIHYAYGDFENENSGLAQVIKAAKTQGLLYTSDPDARPIAGAESRGHLWDNGNDAVAELKRMIKVRQIALNQFGLNSIANGQPFSELENTLVPIYNFHRFQVEAVVKQVAGIEYTYAVKGEDSKAQTIVDGQRQQAAIAALLETLQAKFLTLPLHIVKLIPPKAYGYYRTRESFASNTSITFDPVTAAQSSAKNVLSMLLNHQRLARLQQQHLIGSNVPSIDDLLASVLNATIKADLTSTSLQGLEVAVQQRVNQQVVDCLLALYHSEQLVAEVRVALYGQLTQLVQWLSDAALSKNQPKQLTKQHPLFVQQIAFSLQQGKIHNIQAPAPMPPGSPIGSE
ncbi:zinc-dependent metalloprotease [Thalassotalea aquiviva]|uniref:zinc-dependent metalloprotease n=1 Tax=Thalassotalea aquiviva TaxID=3242415 RepID=UPI00352B5C16